MLWVANKIILHLNFNRSLNKVKITTRIVMTTISPKYVSSAYYYSYKSYYQTADTNYQAIKNQQIQ